MLRIKSVWSIQTFAVHKRNFFFFENFGEPYGPQAGVGVGG